MSWKVINTGARSASENMELDAALLTDLEWSTDPILHLYDWDQDAATFGHFINPQKFLTMEAVDRLGLDLAKRPTGGGIVFHLCDLAFSVLIPASHPSFSINPLDNYAFINNQVIEAITRLMPQMPALLSDEPKPLDDHCKHFCMAKPTKYDVMVGGLKVGGAAQRKTAHGYLHQGSISLGVLSDNYLRDVLASDTLVLEGMRKNSFSLLGESWTKKELSEMRKELSALLEQTFCRE